MAFELFSGMTYSPTSSIPFFNWTDSDLIYGPLGETENLEDKFTNTLNDMNENDYDHNKYSSSSAHGFDSNLNPISYGYQTTTSSSLQSRWDSFLLKS